MAPSDYSPQPAASTADNSIPIEEIIFSCDVCQAVSSDVYATKDSNHGFSSGPADDDGTVVKLWMGDCTHIFCSKHLDGGAVPFHPEAIGPQGKCPVCPSPGESDKMRELFAIRGVKPGEFDESIPSEWLVCPPIKLDSRGPGMDALRFQYNHFVRYSRSVREASKLSQSKRRTMETVLAKERKQWRKREASLHKELDERKVAYDDICTQLKRWNDRKDGIRHYMNIVVDMARDLAAMRTQLLDLGFDVPIRDYAFHPTGNLAKDACRSGDDSGRSHDSNITIGRQKSSSSHKRKLSDFDPYADIVEDPANATRRSEMNHRSQPSGIAQLHRDTFTANQRNSGVEVHSGRDPGAYYPQLQTQLSNPVPRRQPLGQPRHQTQEHIAFPVRAEQPQNAGHRGMPLDDSHQQRFAGQGALSSQQSQRDLISRIGNTRITSEAGRSIPNDGMRFHLEDSHQMQHRNSPSRSPRRVPLQGHSDGFHINPDNNILERFPGEVPRPRVSHFDPSYGTVTQQRGAHAPREMDMLPSTPSSRQWPTVRQDSGLPYPRHSTAQRNFADPPAASVVSPFFKGKSKSSRIRSAQLQRPGDDWRPSHSLGRGKEHSSFDRRSVRGSMAPPPIYSSSPRRDHGPYDQPPSSRHMLWPLQARRPLHNSNYINQNSLPQTESRLPGRYSQRTSLPPVPNSFPRPASQTPRNRISLPPNRSMATTLGSRQDPEVTQIKGMKSAGLPPFDARQLFSAAGSRRSVRR